MTTTLPTHPDIVYWVGSNSETPLRIMFTHEDARVSEFIYLDAFDKDGKPVMAYKLLADDNYSTEF